MQRVLVIGASGNIGTSAVIAALRSGLEVLAPVRSSSSAEKLLKNVGTSKGVTTFIADVSVDGGVKDIVGKVRSGELPPFQHVYTAVSGSYEKTSVIEMSQQELRENFDLSLLPNFYALRDTLPYLLEQKPVDTTWTICTGAQGTVGERSGPAMVQGALFSMVTAGIRSITGTNVRLNEIYLGLRVEVDELALKTNNYKSSDFARIYERILTDRNIKDSRITVMEERDIDELQIRRVEGAFVDWSNKYGQKIHNANE